MFARLSRPALATAAVIGALGAMAAPAVASAQSYGYQSYGQSYGSSQPYGYQSGYGQGYGNGYSQGYVPGYGGQTYPSQSQYECDRQRQGRTGAGAVIGGGAGAVIGSQLAARGRRTEGSILGGVLGAVVGGSVGRSSSNTCYQQGQYSYGQPAYNSGYNSGYNQPTYSSGYSSSYGQSGYGSSYSQGGSYYDENGYGPYASDPRDSYRDDRRDDRYDRRDDRSDWQVSPDGYYVYDPARGWVPR